MDPSEPPKTFVLGPPEKAKTFDLKVSHPQKKKHKTFDFGCGTKKKKKSRLSKISEFWDFLLFFKYKILFLLKIQCKVLFQPHWWDEFFFVKNKKGILDSKVFTFFKPKNDLFGQMFGPRLFLGQRPDFFFGTKKNF